MSAISFFSKFLVPIVLGALVILVLLLSVWPSVLSISTRGNNSPGDRLLKGIVVKQSIPVDVDVINKSKRKCFFFRFATYKKVNDGAVNARLLDGSRIVAEVVLSGSQIQDNRDERICTFESFHRVPGLMVEGLSENAKNPPSIWLTDDKQLGELSGGDSSKAIRLGLQLTGYGIFQSSNFSASVMSVFFSLFLSVPIAAAMISGGKRA